MAFGTSMKLTELLTPPPVPSLLSVYADMEVVERRPRTTQSIWNRESLGRDKNVNFHSHLHLCHGSFQLLGKKDLRQRQIKKPKYSTFHFTSWLGYLEVADGRVVSYQLTKFLSGLQFACIEKTVGYVNPVQGGEHYSSWKRLWSLMWHKLYLVLSRDNHWSSLLHYQLEKLPLNQMIWGESERGQLGFFLLWNQNTSQVLLLLILNTNFILITPPAIAEQCEIHCEMNITNVKKTSAYPSFKNLVS